MTRPTIACYCGTPPSMYAAIFVDGAPGCDQQIAWFKAAHSGPGHLPEDPPRDWYGNEKQLARLLRRLQREAADLRAIHNVDSKGRV